MIVVDTSAMMAIIMAEPEAQSFRAAIADADQALVSAPTALELYLAMSAKLGEVGRRLAAEFLASNLISVADWNPNHLGFAVEALVRFGKGNHPARLNFGDCMAYAFAKSLNAPLLFKGNDFAQTDVRRAI